MKPAAEKGPTMRNRRPVTVIVSGAAVVALLVAVGAVVVAQTGPDPPRFEVDPFWPKALPNKWLMGQAAGVAVDRQDHVWVVQRPRSLTDDEKGATLSPPRNKDEPRKPGTSFKKPWQSILRT